MKRITLLVATALMLLVALPCARAGFSTTPTFDLTTSSNLAGATDAVYTLRAENRDQSEDASFIVIVIPAGYSIGQSFSTNKAGVKAMSAYGKCPGGSGAAGVITTTTPGLFSASWRGFSMGYFSPGMIIAEARITIVTPSATAQGKMEVTFTTGGYSFVNHQCYGEFVTEKGFFINPPTPGAYTWGPSTVRPSSGPMVEMISTSGFSQTIEIVSSSLTTQAVTSTTESSTVLTTTVLPPTTQTTALPATTTPIIVTERETTTTQPAPTGEAFPTGTLTIVGIVLIIIVAGIAYALRRRK